eukprot:gene2677-3873_t
MEKTEKIEDLEELKDFDSMDLKNELLRGIYSNGYEKPTDLQIKMLGPIRTKKDVVCVSVTGSGKTFGFLISMLQNLDFGEKKLKGLIIAPTRELVIGIQNLLKNLGEYLGVSSTCIVGGPKYSDQITELKDGVHIVVATPGRAIYLIEKGYMNINDIEMVVVDEASRVLEFGFEEELKSIFKKLPAQKQICLFTGTKPGTSMVKYIEEFMIDPFFII